MWWYMSAGLRRGAGSTSDGPYGPPFRSTERRAGERVARDVPAAIVGASLALGPLPARRAEALAECLFRALSRRRCAARDAIRVRFPTFFVAIISAPFITIARRARKTLTSHSGSPVRIEGNP